MPMTAITAATPWTHRSDSFSFLLSDADLAGFINCHEDPATFLNILRGKPDASGRQTKTPDLNEPIINRGMIAILSAALIGGGMAAADARPKANSIVNYGAGGLEGARQIVMAILTAAIAAQA